MKIYEVQGAFGLENLKPTEQADPDPQRLAPDHVLVKLHAVSLNYRDLVVVRGTYPAGVTPPFISVSDGTGVVTAVGPGVTRVRVGDRVIGNYLQDWLSGPITEEVRPSSLGAARRAGGVCRAA